MAAKKTAPKVEEKKTVGKKATAKKAPPKPKAATPESEAEGIIRLIDDNEFSAPPATMEQSLEFWQTIKDDLESRISALKEDMGRDEDGEDSDDGDEDDESDDDEDDEEE